VGGPVTAEGRLQHALDLAYRYLGRRDRTVLEVRRHLEGKRVEPSAIDGALRELTESGYLDDVRYAQRFAEDRRELDDWGADRIARRLHAVGVGDAEVSAALAARGVESERDAALGLLRKRVRVAPQNDRERDRALGILVRKGYDLDLAYEVVRAFEREPESVGH
jgi:regulatory protein